MKMRNHSEALRSVVLVFAALMTTVSAHAQVDVLTERFDNARSSANLKETKLNTSNVNNDKFGKLAYRLVDGNIYAQPLIVSQAKAAGRTGPTNMVIVATEHNSVYAFDSEDTNQGSTTAQLWHTDDQVLGKHVEYTEVSNAIGLGPTGCMDLTTEVGITSTPVIRLTKESSPKEGIIFVVGKSKSGSGKHVYKLFALNLSDGKKISESLIEGEISGAGFGSEGSGNNQKIHFDATIQLNRPALLLHNNRLYITFGGHCDRPRELSRSYHGWIFAYDVSDPSRPTKLDVLCTTPNGRGPNGPDGRPVEGGGGIWMSGNGPAVDESGDIYFSVGDGSNDGTASTTDFGDTVIKISLDAANRIRVRDWYAPANQRELKEKDQDLGSAGVVPIPNSHLLLAGGKEGRMYLIDRDAMGKGGPSLDSFIATRDKTGEHYYNIHGAPVIWKRSDAMFVYVNGEESPLNQYKLVPDTVPGGAGWKFDSQTPRNRFDPLRPFATSCAQLDALNCTSAPFTPFPTGMFGNKSRGMVWMPGGFLSLSADQDKAGTGIIWDSMPYADNANMAVVPGVLRAFDASNVSHQLWDSEHGHDQNDKLGQFAKFCPPVVANGKVYVSAFQAEMIREADKMHTKDSGGDQSALAIYGLK